MDAAVAGGFKLVEFTLTTPGCLDSVAEYAANRPEVLTGVGTVMSVDDAKRAEEAEARREAKKAAREARLSSPPHKPEQTHE